MRRPIYALWFRPRPDAEPSEKTDGKELAARMERFSVATFPFYLMLSLSAVLATLGLVANSTATVIGAMIIAPLMAPILSLAFGIATYDWALIRRSAVTVLAGTVCVVTIGYIGVMAIGARIVGPEILARTSPSMIDLAVALAAGCAGAYAQTRPSIADSIAGVAIAVALVPPLAVAGIGLALGSKASSEIGLRLDEFGLQDAGIDVAAGGALLFLTNLAGIIIVAALVFLLQNYGQWKKGLALLIVASLGGYFLVPPLNTALHEIYVKNRLLRLVIKNLEREPTFGSKGTEVRIQTVNVGYRNDHLFIRVDLLADRQKLAQAQEDLERFSAQLAKDIGEDVLIEVDIGAIDVMRLRALGRGS
ncbi:DUF389 domain-containing protein [Roseibium sp. MB-4]